jgi:hypothetical protein
MQSRRQFLRTGVAAIAAPLANLPAGAGLATHDPE